MRSRSEWLARFTVLVCLNFALLVSAMHVSGIRINLTASLPLGLYQEVKGPWVKNDLVMSCLPDAAANLAVDRGYLARTANCDGHTPVIKRVMATAGDVVAVDAVMRINGEVIPNTTIQRTDGKGRSLPVATGGQLTEGQIWLVSNHVASSYDSRHFGAVDASLVMFKVRPVWTF